MCKETVKREHQNIFRQSRYHHWRKGKGHKQSPWTKPDRKPLQNSELGHVTLESRNLAAGRNLDIWYWDRVQMERILDRGLSLVVQEKPPWCSELTELKIKYIFKNHVGAVCFIIFRISVFKEIQKNAYLLKINKNMLNFKKCLGKILTSAKEVKRLEYSVFAELHVGPYASSSGTYLL